MRIKVKKNGNAFQKRWDTLYNQWFSQQDHGQQNIVPAYLTNGLATKTEKVAKPAQHC